MKPILLEAAQFDLDKGIDYYDQQRCGLGLEFAEEVELALERIEFYPEAWSRISRRVRRCLVHRFPYGVIYETRDDRLIVLAIQNFYRKPQHWKSRLK